jgi:group I intron endonuclease
MTTGIYIWKNNINNKCYVGQSINIEYRSKRHLLKNCNSYIGNALKKYGKDNFTLTFIECPIEFLDMWEIFYIDFYDSFLNGYNETTGGNQNKHGWKHSEESKIKMSKNREYLSGKDHPSYGRKLTDEQKKKVGESSTGRNIGRKATKEQVMNYRLSVSGVNIRKDGKYRSRIVYKGKEYPLGVYDNYDDAVKIRKDTLEYLQHNEETFIEYLENIKILNKQRRYKKK